MARPFDCESPPGHTRSSVSRKRLTGDRLGTHRSAREIYKRSCKTPTPFGSVPSESLDGLSCVEISPVQNAEAPTWRKLYL